MPEADESRNGGPAERIWQKEEARTSMELAWKPELLCAMAKSRERLNRRVIFGVRLATVAFAAALLYNVFRIGKPWIRLGQAWTLGFIVYLFGPALERGRRPAASEPCAEFLLREHEERRSGYLRIRSLLDRARPG